MSDIRYTNVRQFIRNIAEELGDLPVVVTRLGKPEFVVYQFSENISIPDGFKAKKVEFVPEDRDISGCNELIRYAFDRPILCGKEIFKDGKCREHYAKD